MRTGYEIVEGSRILAERFGTLDRRQKHPLALPSVEQAVPGRDDVPSSTDGVVAPSPRPALSRKKAT